ncbi:MAG: 2-amino-4-hydroxy-6-hydroxymethyldihydropteridine diphosphokinase [Oscillospiraceae bacterium]|nr:2-amino-4-hydroxy-6-hydroxymethyldihydropteridine diphosphokinase [Oscillospiraceae bacterium]
MSALSKLIIEDLEVFAHHGVHTEEKKLGQKFVVSLEIWFEMGRAAAEDKIESTIHYGEFCRSVGAFLKSKSYDLIEAAAQGLCEQLLLEYPLVKKLKVYLKKPWAPIHQHLTSVGVEVERGRHLVYIALGSNLGDREKNLRDALTTLENHPCCEIIDHSDFCETDPIGYEDQGKFLNGVAEIETTCSPTELMELLLEIEASLGRERTIHWGPRTIDLDILLYDDLVSPDPYVTIPHPHMAQRLFVMQPLCQLAPYAVHPILRRTMRDILDDITGGEA